MPRAELVSNYGISATQCNFIDGSGGGDTTATNFAVTRMLAALSREANFPTFLRPRCRVSASTARLGFVTDFERTRRSPERKRRCTPRREPTRRSAAGITIKGQAFGGYIDAKSGRRLVFIVAVNGVPITSLDDVISAFQDEGTISAILWKLQ